MKTHQEIRDAIERFRRFTNDDDNADILNALNDRIEEVKEYARDVDKRAEKVRHDYTP